MLAPLAAGFALGALLVGASTARPAGPRGEVVPGAYMIEFTDDHDAESFYAGLAERELSVTGRMNMSFSLFRGASFHLRDVPDGLARGRIMDVPGVKNLWPIRTIPRPNDEVLWTGGGGSSSGAGPVPAVLKRRADTFIPHVMTQVDQLRAEGVTGEGVRIGILDVGVDYTHPALGGCFGEGCLVSYGWDFVGENYTGPGDTPHPGPDPLDQCDGHGTHVSGIIAAQPNPMGFTGAAPDVRLGMYKIFGCKGSSDTDIAVAALHRAYDDGSHIISMSVSRESGWSEDPVAVAAQRIVARGVPCVMAAGNSGSGGLFLAGAGANGKGVTSVGSVDSTEYSAVLVRGSFYATAAGPGNGSAEPAAAAAAAAEPFGWKAGTPAFGNVSSLPLYAVSRNASVQDDACSPLPDSTPDLSGHVVLVRQGYCSDYVKAQNIAARGAQYMLEYPYYDDLTALNSPYVGDEEPRIVGTGVVTLEQGQEWVASINRGSIVTVDITAPAQAGSIVETAANPASGGAMSLFSSWGPTWEMDLKPTFSAPGGYILSTWPVRLGGYAIQSGTSMSTPLVSAIFALVGQVRKDFDPETLNNLVATTAAPIDWYDGSQIYAGVPAPPPEQGGGLAQAHRAARATTLVSASSISFNDTAHLSPARNLTITNRGAAPVTYSLGAVAAQTMFTFSPGSEYPDSFPNPAANGTAKLTFSPPRVTVPAGASVEVTVSCEPPAVEDEARLAVYSGWVTIDGDDGGANNDTLSMPYVGAVGSLYAAKVLQDGYVYVSNWNDSSLAPAAANETFVVPRPTSTTPNTTTTTTGPAANYPASVIQLNVGTALLRCDLVPAAAPGGNGTAQALGTFGVFPMEYAPRAYFINAFTGMLTDGTVVPEGAYAFVVRALRIFGDPEVPGDYDVHTTVPFVLKYQA